MPSCIPQGFQQAQMTFPDLSKGASAAIKIFKAIDRVPPIDPESEVRGQGCIA